MSLQCAPCLSDLALVREAVASVGGTATCTAHAVLMRYPSDDPGRRRRRLSDLRTLAESRVVDATGTEKERLELLVQEYAVAEAMDLGAPDRQGPGRGNEPRGRRGKERHPGHMGEQRPPREPRQPGDQRQRGPRPEGDPAAPSGSPAPVSEGAVTTDVSAPESAAAAPAPDPGSPTSPAQESAPSGGDHTSDGESPSPAPDREHTSDGESPSPAPDREPAGGGADERPTTSGSDAPPAPAPAETTHGDTPGAVASEQPSGES